ncbi:Caspase-6 [Orchesella cincta]|uniref:Caspase-6 n=1 Tax=Orchesella cincta TaxID=48709 RepID=A0A1D2MSH8_ORCCI|nr:Caspase-6 [Orchesella cincta]
MDGWQRKRITTKLPHLLKETKVDGLFLTYFSSQEIFTENDLDGILSMNNRSQQVLEFYKIIQTRLNGYDVLIDALKETNQSGVLKLLGESSEALNPTTPAPLFPPGPPVPVVPKRVTEPAVQMRVSEPDFARGRKAADVSDQDQVDFVNSMEPLTVYVTKPISNMVFSDDHYKLEQGFKGYALVLNITEFVDPSKNRGGAKHDTGYMTNLWTSLGYEVTSREGFFTLENVRKILEEFKSKFVQRPAASCVVYIASHGEFNSIHSSDHQSINLYKHIIYNFDSERCEELIGKPKIFIIQACQRFQTDDERTQVDAELQTPIDHAIVCFSTIPGYVSNRDLYLGTWYTYCLTKVFMEEAHHLPLVKMLELTQDTMRNIIADAPKGQLSAFFHLGIKTLYFNMPPSITY